MSLILPPDRLRRCNVINTILSIAAGEIGTTEHPSGSNKNKYGKAYGWDGVSWCVMFVWWCFHQLEADKIFGTKTASCSALATYYKSIKRWVSSGIKRGDLVIMTWNSARTPQHIGIVESVNANGSLVTIEGNTSTTSNDNGGAVMRRTRPRSCVVGACRPDYYANENVTVGGTSLNTVKGTTANETKMIKAIQTAIGANADGEIGTQTMSDIACKLGAKCFPLTLKIYGMPVIIAEDIKPFSPRKALSNYANAISGSFYSAGKNGIVPCSIMIADGKTIVADACHADRGLPESVLYRLNTGAFGIARVRNASALPSGVLWAVGGLGLLGNYNPAAEGFTGAFADVLRDTNHTMLGVKNSRVYMVYCASMTAAQVNVFAKTLGLEYAIQLDGGHVAAINGGESFAKINLSTTQYYAIQAA